MPDIQEELKAFIGYEGEAEVHRNKPDEMAEKIRELLAPAGDEAADQAVTLYYTAREAVAEFAEFMMGHLDDRFNGNIGMFVFLEEPIEESGSDDE